MSLAFINALRSSRDVQPRAVRAKIDCPCSFLKFIINLAARSCFAIFEDVRRGLCQAHPKPHNGNQNAAGSMHCTPALMYLGLQILLSFFNAPIPEDTLLAIYSIFFPNLGSHRFQLLALLRILLF
jgi:hypothetical protein